MQKTPDQIFDEIEFRKAEVATARQRKRMTRIGEVIQLIGPGLMLVFVGYWIKIDSYLFIGALGFVSYGFNGLFKRWSLEDRIETLENKLKTLSR